MSYQKDDSTITPYIWVPWNIAKVPECAHGYYALFLSDSYFAVGIVSYDLEFYGVGLEIFRLFHVNCNFKTIRAVTYRVRNWCHTSSYSYHFWQLTMLQS